MKLLDELKRERDDLDAAIRVLEQRTRPGRQVSATRIARHALNAIRTHDPTANGGAPTRRKPSRRKRNTNRYSLFRDKGREIAEVPIPEGVSFEGVEFPQALALAVRAVKQPIPTPELAALLTRAGVTIPNGRVPVGRYVGMIAANLKRNRILGKSPKGWVKGSRVHPIA